MAILVNLMTPDDPPFLSPPVRMHGGLLCIAFCMSVCLSGCDLTKIQTGPKVTCQKLFIRQFNLFAYDLTKILTGPKVTGQKIIWALRRWNWNSFGCYLRVKVICTAKLMKQTFSLTLHVHSRYTAGALLFSLGPNKGRWAHFNVKLQFFYDYRCLFFSFQFLYFFTTSGWLRKTGNDQM